MQSYVIKLFLAMLMTLFLGIYIFFLYHPGIDLSIFKSPKSVMPCVVLDDEGGEIARFSGDRRTFITYEHLPDHLVKAFIAAEDHDFFNHCGISLKGIIRSFWVNVSQGRYVQGASTITQQLVKLLFFNAKKTLIRKIKEQCIALLVEFSFSKKQIIEMYLNNVYFGGGIYGVCAASKRFWSKNVADLDVAQSALLAAIVKSPTHYYPRQFPAKVCQRRNVILQSMYNLGFITESARQQFIARELDLVKEEGDFFAPHAIQSIKTLLEKTIGSEALYKGGLIIQSTLNTNMQASAYDEFCKHFYHLQKVIKDVDGGLLLMDVATGEIKALIGGLSFKKSRFNRAFMAKRQIGSTFKPLIYAIAMQQGMNFAQLAVDEPLIIGNWKPHNVTMDYEGQMTLAKALSSSNNIIAIKLLLQVGYEPLITLAKQCGIAGSLRPYPSLALGCVEVSLKEVTGMFNVFANNGVYVEPHLVKWVKNQEGELIWQPSPKEYRVLESIVSDQVAKILTISLQRAKKKFPIIWIDADSIGKTGTTNDCRTSWFVGSTPSYTTAIYVGRDDNVSLGEHMYGSITSFPLWLALNKSLVHPKKKFSYDKNLKEINIDLQKGKRVFARASRAVPILVKK